MYGIMQKNYIIYTESKDRPTKKRNKNIKKKEL